MNTEIDLPRMLKPPMTGDDYEKMDIAVLRRLFAELTASVSVAKPKIAAMKSAYEEAQMIYNDLLVRKGKAAYWVQVRRNEK